MAVVKSSHDFYSIRIHIYLGVFILKKRIVSLNDEFVSFKYVPSSDDIFNT